MIGDWTGLAPRKHRICSLTVTGLLVEGHALVPRGPSRGDERREGDWFMEFATWASKIVDDVRNEGCAREKGD
jgi:hypothetical protein